MCPVFPVTAVSVPLSVSGMRLCVWEMESGEGVRGKQGRLRSPFHLQHSEMKWPSQVCGGVGWRGGQWSVEASHFSLLPTHPYPTGKKKNREQVKIEAMVPAAKKYKYFSVCCSLRFFCLCLFLYLLMHFKAETPTSYPHL